MGVLTIRNLSDDVLEALRQQAKANERSTEAEARFLLARAVGKPDRAAFLEAIRRLREIIPPITSPPFAEDLIREDRDR